MGSAEDALAAPRSSGFASDAGAEQVSAGAPRSQAAKLRPTTTRRAVADGGAMNERELRGVGSISPRTVQALQGGNDRGIRDEG